MQELSGWVQEENPIPINTKTPSNINNLHVIVNNFVKRNGSQRCYSLCQRREDFKIKSNLMNDKENQSEIQGSSQNRINELKQIMEFLQYNEHLKYSTHRTFDVNDPKFQPEYQQKIQEKKQRIKLQLQQSKIEKLHLKPLTIINDNQNIQNKKPPLTNRQQSLSNQTKTLTFTNNNHQIDNNAVKIKLQKFIISQQLKPSHCKTDTHQQEIPISRMLSKQEIKSKSRLTPTYSRKSNSHISYEGLIKKGNVNDFKGKQKQLRLLELCIKPYK